MVCCKTGFYYILKKLNTYTYQEVWKFKGFSSPPKGLLVCDQYRVLVIEALSVALIDLRKKDINPFRPQGEDPHKGALKSSVMQSRAALEQLLS